MPIINLHPMDATEVVLLRRIIMQSIPNTAFGEIDISGNTTLLSNCHIKSRLQNLPVPFHAFSDVDQFQDFIDANEDLVVNHINNDVVVVDSIVCKCDKRYNQDHEEGRGVSQPVTTEDFLFFDKRASALPNAYSESNMVFKIVDLQPNHGLGDSVEQLTFTTYVHLGIPYISSLYSICETPVAVPSHQSNTQRIEINPRLEDLDADLVISFAKRVFVKKMKHYIGLCQGLDKNKKKGRLVFRNDMFTMPVYVMKKLNTRKEILFASCDLENFHAKDGIVAYVLKPKTAKHIGHILQEILDESNLHF